MPRGNSKLKYATDTGAIGTVIISNDDAAFPANTPPAAPSLGFTVKNNPGARTRLLTPRAVVLRKLARAADEATGAGTQYFYRTVTILTRERFSELGEQISYLYQGESWLLTRKIPEKP
jgi:hypothetical protein